MAAVAGALGGTDPGLLGGDAAVARCALDPVPILSAAMSVPAVRRAAHLGVGLLFDSLSTPERIRTLSDAYRDAGGNRPCVLVRRAWVGAPPRDEVDRQTERYRGYASAGAQAHWQGEQLVAADGAGPLAARTGCGDDPGRRRRAQSPRPGPRRFSDHRTRADRRLG